jgi:cell division protein YceG involved in septum cleavage
MKTLEQKLTKWFIIAIIVIFLSTFIILAVALFMPDKTNATINNTNEQYINITARKLYDEYNKNVVSADDAYKNKLLLVTGRVAGISNDLANGYYLKLETDNEFLPISCHFDSNDGLNDLKTGDLISIKGRCKGKTIYIYIDDCIVMK